MSVISLGKMLQSTPARADQEVFPYLKASNLTENGLDLSSLQQMPFSRREQEILQLQKDDVVVVEGGSIGRSAWISEDMAGIYFQNSINRVRPKIFADGRYLKYAIESRRASGFFEAITNQATIRHLTADKLANTPVPYLNQERQWKIADYLDHETAEIDALIKQLAEVKTLISDRRRTIIDNSFAHAACPEVALKYLGVLHSGLTLGKRYEVATQKYPYLRVANVQAGHVDLSEVAEIDVPPAVASENRLEPNDVLITEGGDRDKLGRGALWKGPIDPVLHQNHVFAFRCNSKLLPEYLVYALESNSARIYFDQTARQSTNLASTNSTVVKNFKFPAPPTVDQHSIVERLDHEMSEMQEMLANSNRVIDLARERRAALITAAVTGQIDVTAKNKPAAGQLEDDIAQGLHREHA
ncbi:hypothetical protein C1C97_005290 [Kocuria tytonis]|uniref:Type I restriction modification DNA specificity domain-containing protein n=2 Tax=Kocuria tytonis TaxID=2054280 RepID=A0A495AAE6_9MICC|nr:hypothetical protein C1C97_005290 [Kocuria tytonis]